ncbi:hypothetical protein QYF61_018792 [Mycteria americana]|uniref:Uncharacterized protein n=1 Tax=Mycteria americana TaxID=33587 RepID=A0AAN7S3V5_MYCAM|nr:hypothetical protein QYF61_018792 [Mycteria americana]
MLAGLDPLVILYMPCRSSHDDLLSPDDESDLLSPDGPFHGPSGVKGVKKLTHISKSSRRPTANDSSLNGEVVILMLNNPSSLSRSSQDLCSRPFTNFVALRWTRSSTLLVVRGPKLYSRCGFTSAKYRGTISSLVLLATLFDTSQDAIGLLGHLDTLLAHI